MPEPTIHLGPMNPGPCYGATCTKGCGLPVRGVLFYVDYVYWTVGTRRGVSFFYRHAVDCLRVVSHA